MTSKSSIFDSIRVKPKKNEEPAKDGERECDWEGCEKKGTNKAPRGRDREGEFLWFCTEHVRQYNKNYNYFSGMDDDSVATFQKASSTGHRPTWEMSANSWGSKARTASGGIPGSKPWLHRGKGGDGAYPGGAGGAASPEARRQRKLKRLEKQSLDKLSLHDNATSKEIKSKYKQLVKIHHPDANGGDRSSEDRLREIIQAYNFLKSAGFTD
ncbi:MAG: J domain-containing protein [Hyphomicrobiales bacterium]